MNDCLFFVNKEKRRVVCRINGTKYNFINFLSALPEANFFDFFREGIGEKLPMPNSFIGIATCSPDDEWDEELGKKIAYHRAKNNMNRSFFKRVNTFFNALDTRLDRLAETFDKYGEKLSKAADHREKEIKEALEQQDNTPV